ncbi:MAG: nucleotidyl transferase AbiEii/AbiGii toxin family protein [Candidatus Micrarchaeota archaeon]
MFEALSELVKIDDSIIFLGGSAIQATLPEPRRLSIDLDISYGKDPEGLLGVLGKLSGHSVSRRPSKSQNFIFYKLSKDGVEIKLDVSRFTIPRTRKRRIRNFEVLMPDPSYFIAAKFSSLALGTIGRPETEPSQITKDVFDINCILDGKPPLEKTMEDWKHIVSNQNELRGTNFRELQCIESTEKVLLKCVPIESPPPFFITQNALGSFQDTLTSGRVLRQDLVSMAARALLLFALMDDRFFDTEKKALTESRNRERLEEAEKMLSEKSGLAPSQLKALKLAAPLALTYLKYWVENRRSGN